MSLIEFNKSLESLPAVNIKETEKEFNIEFAAPGFLKKDFQVELEGNRLTISAEKGHEEKEVKERFTRKEFSYNSFERSFTLPQAVHSDKADARYKDGILKLSIPKKEQSTTLPKKAIAVV